jgi:hypothetical protein
MPPSAHTSAGICDALTHHHATVPIHQCSPSARFGDQPPFCVFLSFGDPGPFAAEIHEAGAALICQVQFLSQIEMALKAGATAVVVQGTEAGDTEHPVRRFRSCRKLLTT